MLTLATLIFYNRVNYKIQFASQEAIVALL